ncbi:MAG: hypothetical protein ACFFCQ_10125 [Promethearchaeota archaeon]
MIQNYDRNSHSLIDSVASKLILTLVLTFLIFYGTQQVLQELGNRWGAQLYLTSTPFDAEELKTLGMRAQLIGVTIGSPILGIGIILTSYSVFKYSDRPSIVRLSGFLIILLGLVLGAAFFVPRGSMPSSAPEFYWRMGAAFLVVFIGVSLLLISFISPVPNFNSIKAFLGAGETGITLAICDYGAMTASYDQPPLTGFILGSHYVLWTFLIVLGLFTISWNGIHLRNEKITVQHGFQLIAVSGIILFCFLTLPPFLPRRTTFIVMYKFFGNVLVLALGILIIFVILTVLETMKLMKKEVKIQ